MMGLLRAQSANSFRTATVANTLSFAEPNSARPWPGPIAAWYAVCVLTLAYTLGYVDRAILTILVEPIQADLHINDTQISLLNGFAFVIFYVTLGIPLGFIADRTRRKWLITASIAFWSVMTAACGLTGSFAQLFSARIGVGIGEAGMSPASYSMISDYFPPEKRSAALGVYTLGIYLGSGVAILGGGVLLALIGGRPTVRIPYLGDVRSWHAVFFAIGAPGLLVALLAATVREPARRIEAGLAPAKQKFRTDWKQIWSHIGRHRAAYLLHTLGVAFLGTPFNVTTLWARPYLTRHFGLTPAHAAYIVGITMLVFASAGITTGSRMSDRMQARGKSDATIRVARNSAIIMIPWLGALPFMPTLTSATIDLAFILFFGAFAFGAAPAALQLITPNRMRAMISGIYLVLVNLIGLALGPVVTGALTDYVFKSPGAVGYSAAIVAATSAASAAVLLAALLKPFRTAAAAQLALLQPASGIP